MTDLMKRVLSAAQESAPSWLAERQAAGREAWQASDMPTRKTESWKYTSIHALNRDFEVAEPSAASKDELGFDYPYLGGCKLVFVDGFLRQDMSRMDIPRGVEVVRFGDSNIK